jgi:NarL family two-component system response regulator LiaR
MSAVRVALVNDYEISLRGLAGMLECHAAEVKVVTLALDPVVDAEVDVILYDTFGRLPGDEKLRNVIAANTAKVIVYTWDTYPVEAFYTDGAAACIHKGVAGEKIAAAIVAAHKGQVVEPTLPDPDRLELPSWPGQEMGLSARESECLVFIARGLTNQELAERAYLSLNTIKTYIRNAYHKIGVTSRSQAAIWALEHGFVSSSGPSTSGA